MKPNILLFTTDQHRGDHLGLAGHPLIETPNLDALRNEGAYFPNAYSEIPSTTGARRCLLRGQGSHACGLVGYSSTEWEEEGSLARVLADNGYHCLNVGWRNLHPRRKLYGFHNVICHELDPGNDDYWDWLKANLGPEAWERGHGGGANGWLGRPWHLPEKYHPTNWTTDLALEQIRKSDPTRPVFLWLSHLRPHSPYDPPRFFWDMYIDRELPPIPRGEWAGEYDLPQPGLSRDAWRGRLTDAQYQRMRAGYLGLITHIDYEFGRLSEYLRRYLAGTNRKDWLIIFTADHGDMMGDHFLLRKTYAYEGSARIPFVIKYPDGCKLPTGTFTEVVGLQDVLPTVLDFVGVEVPLGVTGRSVGAAIRGGKWREFLHGEHSPCYSAAAAMHYLTDGREKYIWFPQSGREQFFDLVDDRRELHDLAADPQRAEGVKRWRERLIELLAKRDDGFSDGRRLLRKEHWHPEVERNSKEA